MSVHRTQALSTPSTHNLSLSGIVDSVWGSVTDSISTVGFNPLRSFAKNQVLKVLRKISVGRLTVITNTETFEFGEDANSQTGNPQATLTVKEDSFWVRIALFTDLGLSEAYMSGEIDIDDVFALIKVLILNRRTLDALDTYPAMIMSYGRKFTYLKFLGDMINSRANISAHYDLGNLMFKAFLSEDMSYSTAIFKTLDGDLRPEGDNETLEEAQMRKVHMIIKKANIKPGNRVLEIGTGWSTLSITAAKLHPDCMIDTVTLSIEQTQWARARIEKEGLSDRITVHNMDFRECKNKPEWKGAFDRFISVEMVENIGKDFIQDFWEVADFALNQRDAVSVVQVISMPEARIPAYDNANADFIQKWIFPGLYIPSATFLIETMERGSQGRLVPDLVFNIGPHYSRTLRMWKIKFLKNWEPLIVPELINRYNLGAAELESFKRRWIYYFDYCAGGFETRTLGDHVIVATREGNPDYGVDYPLPL